MAGIAREVRRDMVRRLAERIPLGIRTVVARAALASSNSLCGGVGKSRGRERATRRMAGIAREVRRDMVCRFEGLGRSPLDVTGGAGARVHAGVIKRGAGGAGESHETRVALIARGRGNDVT